MHRNSNVPSKKSNAIHVYELVLEMEALVCDKMV